MKKVALAFAVQCNYVCLYIMWAHNQLMGRIPDKLMALSNMTYLLLYHIYNLKCLLNLDLSINEINGTFPDGIGDLAKLETLQLNNKKLSWYIPFGLDKLTNRVHLKLFTNDLTGLLRINLMETSLFFFEIVLF